MKKLLLSAILLMGARSLWGSEKRTSFIIKTFTGKAFLIYPKIENGQFFVTSIIKEIYKKFSLHPLQYFLLWPNRSGKKVEIESEKYLPYQRVDFEPQIFEKNIAVDYTNSDPFNFIYEDSNSDSSEEYNLDNTDIDIEIEENYIKNRILIDNINQKKNNNNYPSSSSNSSEDSLD